MRRATTVITINISEINKSEKDNNNNYDKNHIDNFINVDFKINTDGISDVTYNNESVIFKFRLNQVIKDIFLVIDNT